MPLSAEIHEITKVKAWFIEQMKELVEEEEALLACKGSLPSDEMLTAAKKDGFSDKYLSQLLADSGGYYPQSPDRAWV